MLKEISIEIIRKCPNNCLHCSSLSDEGCSEIMHYDKFSEIVHDAAKLGVQTICLSGGEPFLHTEITNMIALAASLGMQIFVYTSGITFDENHQRTSISRHVLERISAKVTKLIFNIEAATPDTYDSIMGTKDCFEKMKQSIYDAGRFDITIEAHFVPMKMNIHEVRAVVDLCRELRVSKISFLRLVLHGRAQVNEAKLALTKAELAQVKAVLQDLEAESEVDIRIGVPLSADTSCHKCEAANGKLNIRYDGRVFPCEVFKNDRIAYCLKGTYPESIYDSSLVDIYQHSAYLNVVRGLTKESAGSMPDETCVGQYYISREVEV